VALLLPTLAWGQFESNDTSLGDFARSLRQTRQAPANTVIDNDNLSQVMDAVQSQKLASGSLLFSFDKDAKSFEISSPDVTCSLAFTAQAASLLADPYVAKEVPASELAKLDGPAAIDGGELQISMYNASGWDVKEITIGLTFVRRMDTKSASYVGAKLIPAAGTESVAPDEKRSDLTTLYHLKGSAAPRETTVFHQPLTAGISPGQEWHWAIVSAKGIPPSPKPDLNPAQ
jgi:hypothetical protein